MHYCIEVMVSFNCIIKVELIVLAIYCIKPGILCYNFCSLKLLKLMLTTSFTEENTYLGVNCVGSIFTLLSLSNYTNYHTYCRSYWRRDLFSG